MNDKEKYAQRMQEIYAQVFYSIKEITGNKLHYIDLVCIMEALGLILRQVIEETMNAEDPCANGAIQIFLTNFIPVLQNLKREKENEPTTI